MMLEAVSPPSSSSEDFVIVSKSANSDNGKQRRRLQQTDNISNDGGGGGGGENAAAGVDEEIAATTTTTAIDSPNNITANSVTSQKKQQQQRSLLQTLWSEATSTTELHQRRQRRVRKVGGGRNNINNNNRQDDDDYDYSPSSFKSSSKQQQQQRRSDSGKKYNKGHHYNYNYNNSRRAKRLATQVWLAVFAVLAVALLVKIHMFLYYKVFLSNNGSNNNNKNDANSQQKKSEEIDNKHHEMIGVDSDTLQRLLDNHNIDVEDTISKMTLEDAHSHQLTPLPPPPSSSNNNNDNIDTTQYTIRMNTWHRNEQLLLSVNHHSQCDGVAEIQIVWCDIHNDPPDNIVHHHSGKVKVETHTINSLNERFKILLDTPTLGILSLDDDVLRPCEALDVAFLRWVRHPDRMVGFDVRTHVVEELDEEEEEGGGGRGGGNDVEGVKQQGDNKTKTKKKTNWKYGYMSTTEKSNSYSLTLPRASFLHRDYLDLYIMAIPRPIYLYVAQHFECEDIAMSFFISSLTHGAPPLITDYWAVKSMVKLYSESKISGGKDHKSSRDKCVDTFAELLGVKEDGRWGPLHKAELIHVNKNDDEEEEEGDGRMFGYGSEPEDWDTIDESSISSTRLKELLVTMKELKHKSYNEQMKWLKKKKYQTMKEAKKVGMIENTSEWEKRWKNGGGEEE